VLHRSEVLDDVERASLDELSALQLERLRWSVRHAYERVPHYRQAFQAAGVHPEDLRHLEDLARFPFLMKQHFREQYPWGLLAVSPDQLARVHASSGTTGKPTIVGYTQNDLDTWTALVARSIFAAGGRRGDRVHVAYGYGLFTGGLGAHYGAERLGCAVIPASGGQTERQAQLILDLKPDLIMVTPSYMLAIAEELTRLGLEPQSCSLRAGLFGAEPWSEAMRSEIERRTGLDAIDIYGLSEVMGPGVASECLETKDGPVIWEDHFYPEIIDPASGQVLPEGEEGELVLTSLTKEALPVIRYRTRDRSRLLPPTARSMRRLGRISGRTDDMLIIRGVNLFPTQVEALVLEQAALAPHYYLEIAREGLLDTLTLHVELVAPVEDSEPARRAVAHELVQRVKAFVGVTSEVVVHAARELERSVGKARRVIDRRAPR
jgi:phenylacetate-CoA ligase